VYRLALHLVRDPETAQDVTQEAFVHAFRSLPRFRGTAKFSTWLYRIARNCAVDAIRKRDRRKRLERGLAEPEPVADASLRAALVHAIDALPRDLREAFVVIEVFGLSYREAAGVLGVLPGTLKSRMHRTRRLLMKALGEERADEV
jgi:RNA polymerase sigma-70 factor (ECF subfamily)